MEFIKSNRKKKKGKPFIKTTRSSIFRFEILLLTSKVCFSEPYSSKNDRVKSFIFLNSTLISKVLLSKLDRTRAKFWQHKRQSLVISIQAPQKHIGLTVSLNLCLNLCYLRLIKFNRKWVTNFKPRGLDIENEEFSLTFMNLVK